MKTRRAILGIAAALLSGCFPADIPEGSGGEDQAHATHPPRWRVNPEWCDAPLAEVVLNERHTLILTREGDWQTMGAKFTGRRFVPHGVDSFTGEIMVVEVQALIHQ